MDNPQPKILLAADTYYPMVDGTLRFIEEFIKRSRTNFELSLLVPKFDHKHVKGIETVFFDVSKHIKLSGYASIKFSLRNLKRIKQAVKKTDLVFVQGPGLASYLAVYYAHKYRKKVVFYVHVVTWELLEKFLPSFLSKIIKKGYIKTYNRCDLLLLPYYELKEELQEAGVRTSMQIARLGIDINRFLPSKDKTASKARLGVPNNRTIIGYVGRISKEKNTLVLLDAFNKLNPQKFFLLMVGDGQQDIVEKFRQNKSCRVTGFVNNVEDYLQAMDIFVMPSLVETTSLATLEAMSCGLPVIVTKVGFMKEYVVKDYNGLFFPRGNPTMLTLKIEKLLRNQELRKKLSQNARKTIAYSFSWERSINKIKRILLKIYYK